MACRASRARARTMRSPRPGRRCPTAMHAGHVPGTGAHASPAAGPSRPPAHPPVGPTRGEPPTGQRLRLPDPCELVAGKARPLPRLVPMGRADEEVGRRQGGHPAGPGGGTATRSLHSRGSHNPSSPTERRSWPCQRWSNRELGKATLGSTTIS